MPDEHCPYLADMNDGLSQKGIAEKHGVKHQHVRDRVKKWRVDFEGGARRRPPGSPSSCGSSGRRWSGTPRTRSGKAHPGRARAGATAAAAGAQAGHAGGEGARRGSSATRRRQCAAAQWKECLGSYDRAARLDPEGETPDVKAAHDKSLEEARKRER